MKTCGTCKTEKPLEAFYVRPNGRYRSVCKSCEKVANAASYARHAEARRAVGRAQPAQWRAVPGNIERGRETTRIWYSKPENKEGIVERVKSWRAANPERHLETCRRYRSANRAVISAHIKRYRIRKIEAVPNWANLFFIEEAYDLAIKRTQMTGYQWEVDHVVPLRSLLVCGLHVEHNLAVTPAVFNRRKGNRFWPDMPA